MIKNKFVLALIAILLGLVVGGILAAVLLPILESSTEHLADSTQDTLTTVLLIAYLVALVVFSSAIYRLLVRRTADMETELPEEERKPVLAFIGLGLLCAGILLYLVTLSTNRVADLAYLLGQNLVIGLIWYYMYTLLAGKHLTSHQKSFSYVLILASLMTGSYVAAQRHLQEENEILTRMQGNLQRVFESSEDADGRLTPIETDPAIAVSRDPNAIMEGWLNDYLNVVIANQNDYMTELEAVGYFNLLDGERIRDDADMTEGQFILSRTNEIINKYEQLGYDAVYAARDSIQSLNIPESEKRNMETGLNSNLQSGKDRAENVWALERQIIAVAEKILVFLNTAQDYWEYEDEQFSFYNTKSLNIFNAYMAEFQRAADEQEQIQQSSSQVMETLFPDDAN